MRFLKKNWDIGLVLIVVGLVTAFVFQMFNLGRYYSVMDVVLFLVVAAAATLGLLTLYRRVRAWMSKPYVDVID